MPVLEFILRALDAHTDEDDIMKVTDESAAGSTVAFLKSRLRYSVDENGQEIRMVDAGPDDEVGVMMGWELPIS